MRKIVYVSILAAAMSLALASTAPANDSNQPVLCVPYDVAARLVATGQFVYSLRAECIRDDERAVEPLPRP